MAKRTPLERYQKLRKQVSAEVRAQIENVLADANKTVLALSDPNLSYDVRLEIYKSLQGWPRIVLGLYRAELAIAQNNRKENDAPEYGQEKPSEIAQRLVGDVIGLGPDRVRDLCKEGRRHLNQGMPSQGGNTTAAMFKQMLCTPVPESVAAAFRQIYSAQKEQWLSDLMERWRAGQPLL